MQRQNSQLKRLPDDGLVASEARLLGANAWQGPDGSITIEYPEDNPRGRVVYPNEIAADQALREELVAMQYPDQEALREAFLARYDQGLREAMLTKLAKTKQKRLDPHLRLKRVAYGQARNPVRLLCACAWGLPLPADEVGAAEVASQALALGGKAWKRRDGSIIIEYPKNDPRGMVAYLDESEAREALNKAIRAKAEQGGLDQLLDAFLEAQGSAGAIWSKITTGQLTVLWVMGVVMASVFVLTGIETDPFMGLIIPVLLIGGLTFYTLGWRNRR